MFTGIIEALGIIKTVSEAGSNRTFFIESDISGELRIDESVCHNGVCLTIEDIQNNIYRVTAIKETLEKTNTGTWAKEDVVNLERSIKMNGRLDGHLVQGHVDTTATCTEKRDIRGSYEFTFEFDKKFSSLVIEKGSICLNGISLTIFNVGLTSFSVAIIPYTFEHTNMKYLRPGMEVNTEFDILGKYVARMIKINSME